MGGNSIQQTYTNANPAPWSLQEGQPTPTPTPTPTAEPTLQPGWYDGLYEYTGAQPHAVTRVERGENEDTYTYGANGNMLTRVEGEVTWTQTYNAENRLSSISDGTDAWSFTYDGDGRRVRQVGPDGEVTLYLGGGAYEVRDAAGDAEAIKYYGIAGQRVALSGPDGLQFLLTDHLGSVSAVLDAAGNLLGQQRYTPFGEGRFEAMLGTTDFGYTGQRLLAGTGLMDYNARFYAPGLGRWTQPDTIVPGAGNPANLNRLSYVVNSPVTLADPAGHCAVALLDGTQCFNKVTVTSVLRRYGVTITGGSEADSIRILNAVTSAAMKLASVAKTTAQEAFRNAFQPINFNYVGQKCSVGCYAEASASTIVIYSGAVVTKNLILHELGHSFNAAFVNRNPSIQSPYNKLFYGGIWAGSTQVAGYRPNYSAPGTGIDSNTGQMFLNDKGEPISANPYLRTTAGYRPGSQYQHNRANTQNEDFADMFLNWTLNSFTDDAFGDARYDFMTTNMLVWLNN